MERCLCRIAGLLNRQGISWALGASMLLHYKGLVARPGDIDLMVAPEHMEAADRTLAHIGQKRPPNPDARYATKHFCEYVVDGIEVDVMAGFVINHSGGSYEYVLRPETFETLQLAGTSIHLCPMEDWFVLYALMPGRDERVRTIGAELRKHGCNTGRLEWWLGEPLPPAVGEQIRTLLAFCRSGQ